MIEPDSRVRKDHTRPFRQPLMIVLVEPVEELATGIEPASPGYETGVLAAELREQEGASEEPTAG